MCVKGIAAFSEKLQLEKIIRVFLPMQIKLKVLLDFRDSEILDTLADLDIGECITNPSLKADDM